MNHLGAQILDGVMDAGLAFPSVALVPTHRDRGEEWCFGVAVEQNVIPWYNKDVQVIKSKQ